MKQIATKHESQHFQQVSNPNSNPWAGIKEPEPQREEDIVWLTPEEFMDEVKVGLKKIFDERARKTQ